MDQQQRKPMDERLAAGRERLARDPLYRQTGWVAAHARLLALLPGACERIAAPYNMLPDPIWEAAVAVGAVIEKVLVYNPWRGNPAGWGTKCWEDYEPLELFDLIFAEHPPTPGPLWVVTDDCFGQREPYAVDGERLREFVVESGCDLCRDVLFIWEQSPRITLTHHEGAFVHIVTPSTDPAATVVGPTAC